MADKLEGQRSKAIAAFLQSDEGVEIIAEIISRLLVEGRMPVHPEVQQLQYERAFRDSCISEKEENEKCLKDA